MLSASLSHPLPSALIVLATFLLMPWPGYALLHLLGFGRHRWSAAVLAGPAVTLALWIIALSGAAWASISLRTIFSPIWIATVVLAALGMTLRWAVNSKIAAAGEAKRDVILLWITAVVLPFVIMPATLRFGLADFVNSTYADPWSYVMVSDYLSTVARGAEGGLSALHQYASHLMNTRNASSAILAHFAYGFGGIKADQTMTLFCLLLLFTNATALIAFARSVFERTEAALCLALLAGLGWPANIVFAGNFDQLLLLPLLPMIATFALRAGDKINLVAASIMIGLLSAAALFAYVELAFIGIVVAMTFVISPRLRPGPAIGRAVLVTCIAVPVLIVLAWPGLSALMTMLKGQYALTTAATARPGDGYFIGLLTASRLPDTLWAMGGEFPQTRLIALPWLLGTLLSALALLGAWLERRRWAVIIGLLAVAAALFHFNFREHYSYATYKIVSIDAWMLGFLAVSGGVWLARWLKPRLPRQLSLTAVVAILTLAIAIDRTVVQANVIRFKHNALQQQAYREAQQINAIVQHAPTLLASRDDLANEWAVFYLSDPPVLIAPYRLYMAQAHVIPFMERAKPIDIASIRYIVTDRNDAIRASVWGARRIWDGNAFSLWEINDANWVVLADVINPNGFEPGGIWLGGGKTTELLVVTAQPGPATLNASLQPGSRAPIGAELFHATIKDHAGSRAIEVTAGENRLPINVTAGRSFISIGIDDAPTTPPPGTADSRPMILRMVDYGIQRNSQPLR
jgi:hypothetical protein